MVDSCDEDSIVSGKRMGSFWEERRPRRVLRLDARESHIAGILAYDNWNPAEEFAKSIKIYESVVDNQRFVTVIVKYCTAWVKSSRIVPESNRTKPSKNPSRTNFEVRFLKEPP